MNTLQAPPEKKARSGAKPPQTLGYGAALIGEEEIALVTEVLKNKLPFRFYGPTYETRPPMAWTFEQEVCALVGTKFALGVTSGSGALEVALCALGIGPGDEVILANWSWVTCFTAVVRCGATPVLAEIDDTFCIDPSEITRLATPRTKAVLVVHYQGASADMDPIMAAARAKGLAVIEDCAESFGASYKGKAIGSMGDIGIFSLQYNKVLSSGEGGCVVTSDPVLFERAVRAHDLGLVRAAHSELVPPTQKAFCGGQFRMNEMTAAVALAQVRKLPKVIEHCRRLTGRIREVLREVPGLRLRRLPDPAGEVPIETYFWMPPGQDVRELKDFLEGEGIICTKVTGTYCQNQREYCKERLTHSGIAPGLARFDEWPAPGYRDEDFPRTHKVIDNYLTIPVSCYFTDDNAIYIAEALREWFADKAA